MKKIKLTKKDIPCIVAIEFDSGRELGLFLGMNDSGYAQVLLKDKTEYFTQHVNPEWVAAKYERIDLLEETE